MTQQTITPEMTIDQRNAVRSANYADLAANLRAFAARQEARAPGRMDHITSKVTEAALAADRASVAYASGDKAAAEAAAREFGALSMNSTISAAMGG